MNNNSGNSKWLMWAFGIIFTLGMAAQSAQLHYVNLKFKEHNARPHRDTVSRAEYDRLLNKIDKNTYTIVDLTKHIIRLKTIIEQQVGEKG